MLAASGSHMRFGASSRSATRSTAAGAAQQDQVVVVHIPSSREEAVRAGVKPVCTISAVHDNDYHYYASLHACSSVASMVQSRQRYWQRGLMPMCKWV